MKKRLSKKEVTMNEGIVSISNEILDDKSEKAGNGRIKYLVFNLADEHYGIPLSMVKEVIGLTEITKVPNVPEFFKGLINLRGKIISIIDLRTKLTLPKAEYQDKKTTIIIAEVGGFTIGAIVDDVNEVANFQRAQIENRLDIQSRAGNKFITGVAKTDGDKLTLLLDIGKVLSVEEMALLRKQSQDKAA
jgi:purine-binding chemotaxis protein CheW